MGEWVDGITNPTEEEFQNAESLIRKQIDSVDA
jgi:hypothetical protein